MALLNEYNYKEFFENNANLCNLLNFYIHFEKDNPKGLESLKLVLLENKPARVALKDLVRLYRHYKNQKKCDSISPYCDVCGCDPCDCEDWFGGNSK